MRPSQVLRPRYVADRVRLAVHHRLHPDAPSLTADARSMLERWLRPDHVGIEWGSDAARPGSQSVWDVLSVEQPPRVVRGRIVSARRARNHGRRLPALSVRAGARRNSRIDRRDVFRVRLRARRGRVRPEVARLRARGREVSQCLRFRHASELRSSAFLAVDNVNWFLPSTSLAPSSRSVADSPLSRTRAGTRARCPGGISRRRRTSSGGHFNLESAVMLVVIASRSHTTARGRV